MDRREIVNLGCFAYCVHVHVRGGTGCESVRIYAPMIKVDLDTHSI